MPTPSSPLHTVLYDDECPLCVFQMRMLTWLDWGHRLRLLPLSDERAHALAPQIQREDLQEALHCVTAGGKVHRGARCIRFVGMRLPLLMPLALFLWFPGIIFVAEQAYLLLSRNRLLLSRLFGCRGACAILPARRRDEDQLA